MPETSPRPIAAHAAVTGLVAWSMFVSVGGIVHDGPAVLRLLCLAWFTLGAVLLIHRWRSRP